MIFFFLRLKSGWDTWEPGAGCSVTLGGGTWDEANRQGVVVRLPRPAPAELRNSSGVAATQGGPFGASDLALLAPSSLGR